MDVVLQFFVSPETLSAVASDEHMCSGEGGQSWNNSEMSTPLTAKVRAADNATHMCPSGRTAGNTGERLVADVRMEGGKAPRQQNAPKCSEAKILLYNVSACVCV